MANCLEMNAISKRFGGVHALRSVSLRAMGGEVHALLGENGAGKSSLMKVLAGASRPDEGEVYLDGQKLALSSTQAARDTGIAVIYQEFSLAKHLTVAENIFLDDLGFGSVVVKWKHLKKRAREQLAMLGLADLDVMTPVSRLSVAQQQIVEICKALRHEPRVVVVDEPTAVLTERETMRLFDLILRLKQRGVCVIYVSHRLEEVFKLCESATILKGGRNVTSVEIKNIDQAALVHMMVGRELKNLFPPRDVAIGELVLQVRGLTISGRVHDVLFAVRSGEVLGFYGLIGAGRTETMRAIFGADRCDSGEIRLKGRPVDNRSPRRAILSGVGMLPEDRKQQGVLLNLSVRVNAMLKPTNPCWGFAGHIDHRREKTQTPR
jgi:ribose transport system ATP-binding protein